MQQLLLVASQRDAQGRQVSGGEGADPEPASPRPQGLALAGPGLGPGGSHPASPCLLQAEPSHIAEGAEAAPGEGVLVAL